MITAALIAGASTTLTDEGKLMAKLYIRQANEYKARPHRFQNLDTKLDDAATEAGLTAQTINAVLTALAALEASPQKTVMLQGGERAIDFNRERDRQRWQSYLLSVLYDQPTVLPSTFVSDLDDQSSNYEPPDLLIV